MSKSRGGKRGGSVEPAPPPPPNNKKARGAANVAENSSSLPTASLPPPSPPPPPPSSDNAAIGDGASDGGGGSGSGSGIGGGSGGGGAAAAAAAAAGPNGEVFLLNAGGMAAQDKDRKEKDKDNKRVWVTINGVAGWGKKLVDHIDTLPKKDGETLDTILKSLGEKYPDEWTSDEGRPILGRRLGSIRGAHRELAEVATTRNVNLQEADMEQLKVFAGLPTVTKQLRDAKVYEDGISVVQTIASWPKLKTNSTMSSSGSAAAASTRGEGMLGIRTTAAPLGDARRRNTMAIHQPAPMRNAQQHIVSSSSAVQSGDVLEAISRVRREMRELRRLCDEMHEEYDERLKALENQRAVIEVHDDLSEAVDDEYMSDNEGI
jgi:hypothetical protein